MRENNDEQSNKSGINRRSLLRGAAAATVASGSLAALSGSATAKREPIAQDRAAKMFDSKADELLNTLSEEGLLEDASADVLSTAPTIRRPADVGVARVYNKKGNEFYVAREETEHGKLTIFVKAATDETLGVLSTDDGIETYNSEGSVDPELHCSCSDTACPDGAGNLKLCYYLPAGCC